MMNNPKNYIKEVYTPNQDEYEIYAITEEQEQKLKDNSAKLMRKILNNFPYYETVEENKEIYIYPDFVPIIIKFNKERKKLAKRKKIKRVNRKKSKNIAICSVIGTIAAIIIVIGSVSYANYKNQKPKSNSNETIKVSPEKINDDDLQEVLLENETLEELNIQTEEQNLIETGIEDFHYSYSEYVDKQAFENAKEYDDLFIKYGNRYGIDDNLICAIVAKESSGMQTATNGYAYGLMGVENIWANATIKVYNFETKNDEKIIVDYNKVINDAEYNIMIGTAILQQNIYATINSGLVEENEILAYATQRYNMGSGNMQNNLANNQDWMDGRKNVGQGDPEYFEKVFSKLENGTIIEIKIPDGASIFFRLTNDEILALGNSHRSI